MLCATEPCHNSSKKAKWESNFNYQIEEHPNLSLLTRFVFILYAGLNSFVEKAISFFMTTLSD